ncbi:phosphoribosyltransferase [Acanthamoeba castellanii str. Neff]|uniref:Phosphoribosyltransferase n=1 Tax=Acanthamoeba castellanii (strain ATCC 30010 / Neff) TaxID=1257118 RepID=L8H1J0_ACACF|nr:phosphoribosyltransferase [Acanthamoeba castellanii str. Neff]ELR18618.1 phosphoribosyltransferase [Acanthamoeba castellanii str. Neff]
MADEVKVEAAPGIFLSGNLNIPPGAKGIVVFAHGSGSGRFRYVARVMQEGGLGTFLFDLLTPKEEEIDDVTRELRFNIPFLADRMVTVTKWLRGTDATKDLNVGYFGASTGGGAAIVAAARLKGDPQVQAVVSRGGRPDLAGKSLRDCIVPTLLLVGGWDGPVIDMNKDALDKLAAPVKELRIIPGATHLFEEPGKLEEVARQARDWFKKYLDTPQAPSASEER